MISGRPSGTFAGLLEVVEEDDAIVLTGPCPVGARRFDHAGEAARELLHATIKLLMTARTDLLWLHAGAAAHEGQALIFCAPSAHGKSTLISHLIGRGWQYYSDEIAVVDPGRGTVLPFPLQPHMRVHQGAPLSGAAIYALRKIPISIAPHAVATQPAILNGIYFLAYDPGGARALLTPCSPGETVLELLSNSLAFTASRSAEMHDMCRLAGRVNAARLVYAKANEAVESVLDSVSLI